jgi:hypothetical protein
VDNDKTKGKYMTEKIGRNDPCSCGSGKKYKACCLGKQKPAYVLGKRKFTAKVISKESVQTGENQQAPGGITPPNYNNLMERSFGTSIHENELPKFTPEGE